MFSLASQAVPSSLQDVLWRQLSCSMCVIEQHHPLSLQSATSRFSFAVKSLAFSLQNVQKCHQDTT